MVDQSNILSSCEPFFINEVYTKVYINSNFKKNQSKFLKRRYTQNGTWAQKGDNLANP